MDSKVLDAVLLLLLVVAITAAVLLQGFTTVNLSVLQVLQLTSLFILLTVSYRFGIRYQPVFLLLLGIMTLLLAGSSLVNPIAYNALNGFFHFFSIAIWYLIVTNFLDNERRWRIITGTVLVLGIVTSCYTLVQACYLGVEAKAFFVQQNTNAAFLNIVVILVISVLMNGRMNKLAQPFWTLILITFFYFTLFTIAGRGALLGNLAGLVLIFAALFHLRQPRVLLNIILCAGVAFVLAGFLNQWSVGTRFVDLKQDMVKVESLASENTFQGKKPTSVSERILIWKTTLEMLKDTPWYGSGYGSFHMRYPAYRSDLDTSSGQYVHNDYLQFLIEFGYPGVLFVVILIAYLTIRLIRMGIRNMKHDNNMEAVAMFAAMTAVSVHSLVSYNFFILPVLILFSICLGRFLLLSATGDINTFKINQSVSCGAYVLGSGTILMLPILAFIFNILMNYAYETGHQLYDNDQIIESEKYFIKAQNWFDTENIRIARALVNLSAAEAIADKNSVDYGKMMNWGIRQLDRAERLNPWQAQVNYVRGLYYLEFGDAMSEQSIIRAKQEFVISLKKNKRYLEARLALARVLIGSGDATGGYQILEQGLMSPLPNSPEIEDYLQELVYQRKNHGLNREAEQLARRLEHLRTIWSGTPEQQEL